LGKPSHALPCLCLWYNSVIYSEEVALFCTYLVRCQSKCGINKCAGFRAQPTVRLIALLFIQTSGHCSLRRVFTCLLCGSRKVYFTFFFFFLYFFVPLFRNKKFLIEVESHFPTVHISRFAHYYYYYYYYYYHHYALCILV
jgi:hypothetical protein